MTNPFVTMILAGGKGTRMGSSDKHKVCFEVLGKAVIIRALETYNLCGSTLNVIVVGMFAESVMQTVNAQIPGVAYAFQETPMGTGDAARKGAEILERIKYRGDILVVAGDKVVEPHVIKKLIETHQKNGADLTLATAKRPSESSTGIILKTAKGRIAGILEESERRRLAVLEAIHRHFEKSELLSHTEAKKLAQTLLSEKQTVAFLKELWPGADCENPLNSAVYGRLAPGLDGRGILDVGGSRIPAGQILDKFDQMNLSTYVYRASILYDSLHQLRSSRPNQELYLTDTLKIIAGKKDHAKIYGCEIPNTADIMAFNNPQELLLIEECYRQKDKSPVHLAEPEEKSSLAPAMEWLNFFQNPSGAAKRAVQSAYIDAVPWFKYEKCVSAFAQRYPHSKPLAVFRSPGRINLLGRHIDHQGGVVNVMAIDREIILATSPRNDDTVNLANADTQHFREQSFKISDLIANLDWDDWRHVIDGPRVQRMLDAARGDWANYVKAALLRLQELFRDRRLKGMDIMVWGDIPMGAGLSSSSALVVATADAVKAFNRLPVSTRRLVSLCGEGEWFVGTRGGSADHAAIKLAKKGYVTQVSFFPFDIGKSARFFPDHNLVVCNSGIYAGKSSKVKNQFNEKVTAYHVGRIWMKMMRPELGEKIQHLRDINETTLGLSRQELAQLLGQLPLSLTRRQIQAAFGQMAEPERQQLERLFLSHDSPKLGYPVRDVVMFGLAEMARARRCLELLEKNNAVGMGDLMRQSHDGDRVSHEVRDHTWLSMERHVTQENILAWARDPAGDIGSIAGAYGCSLPEIDRIVDVACRVPGVRGAQLAGAGLGGSIMVLVSKKSTASLLEEMEKHQIEAELFHPIAGSSQLLLH